MRKNNAIKWGLFTVCLFLLILSGCSSASSVTFEQMAKWENGVFVSEFSGFSVEIPENWSFLSDSEIEEQVEGMDNVIYGTPKVSVEQLQKTDGLYPLIFVTETQNELEEESFASAFIIFERLGSLAKMSVKTADKYLEILKEGYLEEDASGLNYSFEDIYSINIGDVEYRCLPMSVESYQIKQVFAVRIKDDFVIGLIFTATDNHPQLIEDALSAFTALP